MIYTELLDFKEKFYNWELNNEDLKNFIEEYNLWNDVSDRILLWSTNLWDAIYDVIDIYFLNN